MNHQLYFLKVLFVFAFLFIQGNLSAQWSLDPSLNMAVCDTSGEQALTKNAANPWGGVYVSWFDQRAGSYAVYLQRLDQFGNKLWGENGLLVSNNPQSSSLVDYDLQCDAQGNAIIAFTDTRNGSSINPFVYKISQTGEFLWGNNGISLSDTNSVYQANPKIVCASDGTYWVIWIYGSTPKRVGIQRLNSAGVKQFTPTAKYLASTTTGESYEYPSAVVSDNGSVIIMWSGWTGTFLNPQNYKIYTQKYSPAGSTLWNATRDTVYSLGRVTGFYVPYLTSDGENGAVYSWQDDRNSVNSSNCYVQRKTSAGQLMFPVNGSVVATNTSDIIRFTPSAAVMPVYHVDTGWVSETYVYWKQTNGLQSLFGIYGQRFNASGVPLWNAEDGKIFKSMDGNSFSSLATFAKNERVFNFYLDIANNNTATVKGFANNPEGTQLWPGMQVTISSASSNKLRAWTSMTTMYNFVLTWEDERNDGGGIYGQNVNWSGGFGVPVELVSFNASANGNSVLLNWRTASEKNNKGFFIERRNNNSWSEINFVKGFGTTTDYHNYSFEDKDVPPAKIAYRLKQVDFDGSVEYSKIIEVDLSHPYRYSLEQNYPNPFNPSTIIKFSIAEKGKVMLKVFDITGREIAVLVNEEKETGSYEVSFNGNNLSSGLYFYELSVPGYKAVRKMVLIK